MRFKQLLIVLVCPVLVIQLSSCAKEDANVPPRDPFSFIEGSLQSTCVRASDFGISESVTASVESDTAVFRRAISREGDCSLPDIEIKHTAVFAREKIKLNSVGTHDLELTTKSVSVKPLTALGVSMLQIRKWCGMTDWKLGEEKDVTPKPSEKPVSTVDTANCVLVPMDKQVFYPEGDKLYFGKAGSEIKTLVSRPLYFVKKKN